MRPDIEVREVSRTYLIRERRGANFLAGVRRRARQITALDHVSMTIEKGEAVGVIGLNGSGKSTLVKLLAGIIKPDRGFIRCLGFDPFRQRKQYVKNIGVSFGQKTLLYPDLTLEDSLELYRVVYGLDRAEFEASLASLDEFFDIATFLRQPVRKLSFGQRVRGDLVASVLHFPQLLFLDEPSIGLDALARESLAEYIRRRSQEGKTTLLVYHDIGLVAQACDRLIVMHGGKKAKDCDLSRLDVEFPRTLEVVYDEVYDREQFDGLIRGMAAKEDDHRVTILVKEAEIDDVVQAVVSSCRVLHLDVKPPPIEEVIRKIMSGERAVETGKPEA